MADSSFFLESGVFYPFDTASGNIGGGGSLGQFTIWTGSNLIGSAGAASGSLLDSLAGFADTGFMQRTGAGAYSFSPSIPISGLPALTGEVTTASWVSTINKAIAPTWTGLHTFGDGISILPGGTIQGLNTAHSATSQTVAGISTFPFFYQASPSYMFNQITVVDGINVTTGGVNHGMSAALGIGMETGGSNSQGTKVCLECQIVCDIAGANPTYGRDRAAASFDAFDSVGDGGTATDVIGHTKGTIFAAGFQTVARAGALNLLTAAAVEFNTGIFTGASAWSRFGASAVSTGNLNAVSNMDVAFEVSSFSGSPAWKTGLMFSSFHGGPAVTTTGTLIGDDGVAYTAASAIDLSHGTFSSFYLKFANFTVDGSGNITGNSLGANVITVATDITFNDTAFMQWSTRGAIAMSADGVLELLNHAGTGFGRIQLGGTTASFPAIKQNGAAINFRLADDSADASITAGAITSSTNVSVAAVGGLIWSSRSILTSPTDGNVRFTNNAATDFGLLQIGGTTSSFPAIKRNTTGLRLRLADDSADTGLTLSTLSSGSNQVVGARVTGYVAMTGTADKASTFATGSVTLAQLAGRVMQLQADLTTHGLIG